jgi:homocysteine S-methyltransferase
LQLLREAWDGPVYAYPHHGVFEIPNWRFDNTLPPEEFVAAAMGWVDSGTRAVGGCCGIRPAHIAALNAAIGKAQE